MAAKRDLLFRYLGDSKSLVKASGRAERALGGVDQKTTKTGKAMSALRGTAGKLGVVLGGAALAGQARVAINRAEEMNSAYAATEQIIKATGGAANLTGGQVKGMATELSLATGVDKALIIEGQNLLLTFKNIREEVGEGNDIFSRAQGIMLDFSAVMKTDAKSAALQLGKALNDPIKGITALARVGVAFTDVQKEQIRNFVESGDIIGAQKVILRELEGQVAGVAVATADSTAKISNAWKEVQEQIGNVLLPAIDALVPAMQAVAKEAPSATKKIGLGFSQAKRSAKGFLDVLDVVTGPIFNIGDAWKQQEEVLFQVNKRMVQYSESLAAGGDESNLFVSVLADMIDKGDFTVGTLDALQEATGISGDEFKEAALQAFAMKDELGITEEAADLLRRELRQLEMGTSDMSTAAGDAIGPLDGMADSEEDVANRGKDALTAVKNLKEAMKELTDPVFAAKRATEKLEETLERIQEDLVITEDEAAELTQAWIDQQVAADKVSAGNIIVVQEASTEAMGLIREGVEITKGSYASLLTATSGDIRAFISAAQVAASTPLRVEITATQPSRSTMDRLVREALTRNGRRQTGF